MVLSKNKKDQGIIEPKPSFFGSGRVVVQLLVSVVVIIFVVRPQLEEVGQSQPVFSHSSSKMRSKKNNDHTNSLTWNEKKNKHNGLIQKEGLKKNIKTSESVYATIFFPGCEASSSYKLSTVFKSYIPPQIFRSEDLFVRGRLHLCVKYY